MNTSGSELSVNRNQPGAWRSLPVLMILSALSLLDRQILSLMVDPIKADLGISDFQIGLLQGFAFAVFYCVAGIPIGWCADRYSRRPLIWLGVTVWSLSSAACGLAQSFWALLAARLAVGAGEATLYPAANSILADLFRPARLALALSVLAVGANVGNGFAIALGGQLVSFAENGGTFALPWVGDLRSWQFVFLVTGLPGLAMAFLIFAVREPERRSRSESHGSANFRRTLRFIADNRNFFTAHFIGFGLYSVLVWSFFSWVPTYMVRNFGWSIGEVSLPLAGIATLGATVGTVLSGSLVDYLFGRGQTDAHMRVYAIIAIGASIVGSLAFQVRDPYLFLLLALPIAGTMTLGPIAIAALQIVAPNQMRGQINAIFLLVVNGVGLGLGPPLVGAITDFVFRDELYLGSSITVVFATFGPLSALVLWVGSRSMRTCVERAGTWT